ncbi:ArsC family reductase [Alteromonas lipolytica]|uniref:Arsenate reductase n=1 Tax=Alteromonas lipolytica TaxID=1856405 RepID=A0A1E8FL04_9ALTE|nr:ArsC family reductase [Alteromonas lipolytica]OFI36446.1 arsenate reductase [Alteromonas lipolytica]GGF70782.1 arsenate reductase [Alteromonas lipolytica]
MTVVMYGIPNCDTIKKAKNWLTEHDISFEFHDYRKQGVPQDVLEQALAELGWEQVLNKRGTTYRQLSDDQKASLSAATALPLLTDNPAMIKRPLLAVNGQLHLGFKPAQYQEIFNS